MGKNPMYLTSNAYQMGYADGVKEAKAVIADLMIDMLNDGMIETRDIGNVNTRIRKAMEE